jgi:hypothetical protein
MKSTTNYITPRQSLRIAGFLLVGAAALAAQSATSPAAAKPHLIASNTPTNVLFPKPTELAPVYMPQAPSTSTTSQPVALEAQKASAPVVPIVNSALIQSQPALGTVTLASVKEHTSTDKAWFSAGEAAFPATIRTKPNFGLPANQYGAGPAAVSFHFGHK